MDSCATCGTSILFGGVHSDGLRFCNASCQEKGQLVSLAARVSEGEARSLALQIHAGLCPKCHGPGPVDVHTSYRVWSILVMTQWQSRPQVSCRGCGVKSHAGNLAISALCGWWGFPWGLIFTPIQVTRNILALASGPNPAEPSPKLVHIARMQLASRTLPVQPGT